MRSDLQALSPDDLASIANRGLLKRAMRELESGKVTADWIESDDGTIEAKWSDGVVCVLPGGQTVHEATCDCAALEMCRHIVRTVLAWQTKASSGSSEKAGSPSHWDPGQISEDQIESQVPKTVITKANSLWKQGILAELLRSAKPSARFHCPGHTVRFPVPEDLRYAQCSCSDPAPCVHAVLAVRAFRLLEAGAEAGIVHEGASETKVDPGPLEAAANCIADLIENGFASINATWRDRVLRVSADCQAAWFIWPGQILEELADDFVRYANRDAVFSPQAAAHRIGEFFLRSDAIQSGKAPVPQAFIRGTRTDRDSNLGAARFVGLGGVAHEGRASTILTVFLQDCDTGHPVSVTREFKEDPDSDRERKPFYQLARMSAVKDASLGLLAGGQLVTQGGKRKASGKLVIGRARAAVNPQNFVWEQLKAPVLVEDTDELLARLRLLPPASFRPRSTAGDFHVCPLGSIEDAGFEVTTNSIKAVVKDVAGNLLQIRHPWTERGQGGAEAFLSALQSGAKPKFVAGHVRNSGPALSFQPTAYVSESEGVRTAVLPWLDSPAKGETESSAEFGRASSGIRIRGRYDAATEVATEIILNGLRRLTKQDRRIWERAIAETEASGHHKMAVVLRAAGEEDGIAASLNLLRLLTLAGDLEEKPV